MYALTVAVNNGDHPHWTSDCHQLFYSIWRLKLKLNEEGFSRLDKIITFDANWSASAKDKS